MNEAELSLIFKKAGLRITGPRKAFASVLLEATKPLSAKAILEKLKGKQVIVNKTTVYREIERLEKLGMLRGIELGDRQKYYELTLSDHHHHLVCVECESVEDVDLNESALSKQEKQFTEEKNFKVLRHSLEFFGICQKCQCA